MPRQYHHCGTDAYVLGARRQPGEQIQGRGELRPAGKVMLHHEGAVIAEGIGFDVVVDAVLEALADYPTGG